jgi:anti-sigma regulatory factor (Ser/Thr protein kinase)
MEVLRHQIPFRADATKLCGLRNQIYQLCEEEGLPAQATRLMVLAIDEAVTNIIEHGELPPARSVIEIALEIGDGKLIAEISDGGKPFDPTPNRKEPSRHGFPRRGFGLYLIHKIVDAMHYERTSEGCNVLTLTKSFE